MSARCHVDAKRRTAWRAALLAPAALLGASGAGCAALDAPQTRALATQQGMLPTRSSVPNVPFFPQTPFHCGPAALATVLHHAGFSSTSNDLTAGLFIPAREGTLQVEMVAAARRAGAVPTRIPGDLRALMQELVAGHPVLLLQNLGLSFYPQWHYAVVVGHALDAREFILRSGTEREQRMGFNTLEHTWERANHWALVVLPPGQWPITARQDDAEQSAAAFERTAATAVALPVYQSLLQRWPDSLVAMMGQGNVSLKADNLRAAADAYTRAATRHNSAAAWNNLAVARAQLGDAAAAMDTALKAVERAQSQEPALLVSTQVTLQALQRGEVPR